MKRIISKKEISQAYGPEASRENLIDEKIESFQEKADRLPKEIFQILGDLVSFMEEINSLEEEN